MHGDAVGTDERRAALTRQAAGGDAVALKLLLTESHGRLCAHLSQRIPGVLRRTIDPEDIVQEAEIEVFCCIDAFEPRGPNSFYRWLATIALSRLRDAIRGERAAKRGGGARVLTGAGPSIEDSTVALVDMLAGPDHTPSQSVARGEAIEAVETALSEIPEHYRRAIRLVRIEGRTVAEAAAQMGCTERAVHGLCRRGLEQLQDRLRSASRFFSRAD